MIRFVLLYVALHLLHRLRCGLRLPWLTAIAVVVAATINTAQVRLVPRTAPAS